MFETRRKAKGMEGEDEQEEEEEEEEEEEIVQNRKGPIIVTAVWLLKRIGASTLFGEITKLQIFIRDANFAINCCA